MLLFQRPPWGNSGGRRNALSPRASCNPLEPRCGFRSDWPPANSAKTSAPRMTASAICWGAGKSVPRRRRPSRYLASISILSPHVPLAIASLTVPLDRRECHPPTVEAKAFDLGASLFFKLGKHSAMRRQASRPPKPPSFNVSTEIATKARACQRRLRPSGGSLL